MTWNWQKQDWPRFSYRRSILEELEACFLRQSGVFSGSHAHIKDEDRDLLKIELLSHEGLKTAEIEGETLNRESLQSSLRRNFGLQSDRRRVPPAEQGLADMMTDLYRSFADPLRHASLFRWHQMLSTGRRDLRDVGRYRKHAEPMQIVSGPVHDPKVHFEAPPSHVVPLEMKRFVSWFNETALRGGAPLPALARSGIAHLYFESIHPFEDGNGRIGRAIAEKVLSQSLGQPTLIALSQTIQNRKKSHYEMLEKSNKTQEVTEWLRYFAQVVLDAQAYTQTLIDFLIDKAKFYQRHRGRMNERQEKVISRIFREGPEGFKGGMSAEKYIGVTGTSRATATRDLQDLVEKGLLSRTGALKSTRYNLILR